MERIYDAIVVGARCAGSPTAMLLARKGHRVLLVDKATFPSDTVSTLFIHPPGVARLQAWGLLDRLRASGCPPVESYSFDFGAFTIAGSPRPVDGVAVGYGPRRTVLDKLLVDAAAEDGADVEEAFTVDELVWEDGQVAGLEGRNRNGKRVTARARVVVGADGRHSTVAKAVRPEAYHETPPLQVGYYSYWSGLPTAAFEIFIRPGRGFAALPTHDELTLVVAGWPYAELKQNRRDVEGSYLRTLELAPAFAERVHAARREARFAGTAVESFFRKPYGPGWALVGDAGYDKDPVTAWGISDAFRDAELCAAALDEWLTGERPFESALADYQRLRDQESLPMFELTCGFATMEPPPPDLQRLLAAVAGNSADSDAFVSTMAGTLPAPEFFAPANAERIIAAAAQRAHEGRAVREQDGVRVA
jgi:2-polyprenyl-6-methoxyphenol hydroxylase-like FAD-dependent oxidoreductase